MIAIIDYDAGNIRSVEKAMAKLGQEVWITRDRERIMNADKELDLLAMPWHISENIIW